MRRKPPIFPPSIWNVHTITIEGGSRTNNICRGWNNAVFKLVGHSYPTIWRAIGIIHKDQAQVATIMQCEEQGETIIKACTQTHSSAPEKIAHSVLTFVMARNQSHSRQNSTPEKLLMSNYLMGVVLMGILPGGHSPWIH